MATTFKPPVRTVGDLLRRLGDVPADRVRFHPVPGTATVADLLRDENRRCELIDDTLVEKPTGVRESFLALVLAELITPHVRGRNLGILTGAGGTYELVSGLVRLPDLAFVSWDRLPGRRVPAEPVPNVVPDLAVEILSARNTPAEMARKRGEYFRAGVRLVWEIDPRKRTVRVYTSEAAHTDLTAADTLDGSPVLPGVTLPLAQLFAELDRHG
ncbi:MAG TPA: Uma2 family endonuclease [Urbifossiella sp.]|jgi:Uma2 family endonuclease|nr:Uma2 family endonuclease [Urbifossiella sp.]